MHALFFEVRPLPGHLKHYFDHVDRLRPALARQEGLAFLERYAARGDEDLLLSHQLWESEAAIVAWRSDAGHRYSQSAGRQKHFADYRIRVGARVLHWHAGEPDKRSRVDASGDLPRVVALYGGPEIAVPEFTAFESVNQSGRFVALADTGDPAAAEALFDAHAGLSGLEAAAIYAIRRDYGQFDRAQAPG
ncbi:MAG: antibiotic biosynthesis monooxygenase [Salinarimonas sp.]|nr:antibiotic biosynthesis monooxygenase [Salinarimonas sp.]